MTFSVSLTRLVFDSQKTLNVPPGEETNSFRGSFGAALRKIDPALYTRWFDPQWPEGPSGYKNAPRPFVLRWSASQLQFITFLHPLPSQVEAALPQDAVIKREPLLRLPVLHDPIEKKRTTLRLNFVTPVELKKEGQVVTQPDFTVLIERLVERIWALGCLYQNWPVTTDLTRLTHFAREVQLTNFEWRPTHPQRRSARSGQLHGLGGLTGWAEYTGPLSQFLPLLSIGAWTGVGRQTVWGKGAFRIET